MYAPPPFREGRPDILRALISTHLLATLVTVGDHGMVANHVPFALHTTPDGDVLKGHLAKANDQLPSL